MSSRDNIATYGTRRWAATMTLHRGQEGEMI